MKRGGRGVDRLFVPRPLTLSIPDPPPNTPIQAIPNPQKLGGGGGAWGRGWRGARMDRVGLLVLSLLLCGEARSRR